MENEVKRCAERVGYSPEQLRELEKGGHRTRHVRRLARASQLYSIEAVVTQARHCNSGFRPGDIFVLDVDGNFITKLCPKKMCVYLLSQLAIPVALINERLSEAHDPNHFHFMRYVRCPDTGVECLGYGEVMLQVRVVPREKYSAPPP